MKKQEREHSFSIEMGSKGDLSHVSLTDESEGVLIKGKLGKLQEISHEEGLMVKIVCDRGVLRIDLTRNDLSLMNMKEAEK